MKTLNKILFGLFKLILYIGYGFTLYFGIMYVDTSYSLEMAKFWKSIMLLTILPLSVLLWLHPGIKPDVNEDKEGV